MKTTTRYTPADQLEIGDQITLRASNGAKFHYEVYAEPYLDHGSLKIPVMRLWGDFELRQLSVRPKQRIEVKP